MGSIRTLQHGKRQARIPTVSAETVWDCLGSGDEKTLVKLIKSGAEINIADEYGRNLLRISADRGYRDVVKALIEIGEDVNDMYYDGDHALLQAVLAGHKGIVEMLLDAGADIDHQNCNGNCPIEEAVSLNDEKMVELLLKRGANPDVEGIGYDTVLNQSILKGEFRIVELLLEYGVSIEPVQLRRYKPDEVMSEPPLVIAAGRGNLGMVKLLLDKGADVNAKSRFDVTALDVAERVSERKPEIIDLLRSHGAKMTSKGDENGNV